MFMENVLTKLIRTNANAILVMKETGVTKVRKYLKNQLNSIKFGPFCDFSLEVLHPLYTSPGARHCIKSFSRVDPCRQYIVMGFVDFLFGRLFNWIFLTICISSRMLNEIFEHRPCRNLANY